MVCFRGLDGKSKVTSSVAEVDRFPNQTFDGIGFLKRHLFKIKATVRKITAAGAAIPDNGVFIVDDGTRALGEPYDDASSSVDQQTAKHIWAQSAT